MAAGLWSAVLPLHPVWAGSSGRVRQLELRVAHLERQLAEIEALLRRDQGLRLRHPATAADAPAPSSTRPRAVRTSSMAPARRGPARSAAAIRTDSRHDPPPSAATPARADREAVPELNVIRQNAVVLNPRGIEISTEMEYASRRSALQQDRGFVTNTSIRYGALRWLELSLTIPVGYTERTTTIGPAQDISKVVSGVGDLLVQANAKIVDQTQNWPGVVFSLGGFLPTGPSPYRFANYAFDRPGVAAVPNPSNLFYDYYSQGAWGVRTNLQFYKTLDPLILFFGFGADHFFPQTFGSYTVSTGMHYHYNLGFSFAVSESTTLGFTLTGDYLESLKVNGRSVFESASEPTVARLTFIQRIAKQTYAEPAVSFGLNQDAPNFVIGLGLRKRF